MADLSFHASSVGPVIDVARHSWWKALFLGAIWSVIGVPCLMTAAVILYIACTEKTEWFLPLTALPMLLFGWCFVASALYWFRTAFQGGYYFRAGHGGLAVRVPGTTKRFGLGINLLDFDVPWKDIKRCYPFLRTINGITSESAIIVEGEAGWKARIHTAHFFEARDTIAGNIAQAAKLPERQSA